MSHPRLGTLYAALMIAACGTPSAPSVPSVPSAAASIEPSQLERDLAAVDYQLYRPIQRWRDAPPEQFEEADRALLEAVPRASWRPAHYLRLANVLECERPDLAHEFLEVARAAYPSEPAVLLSWAVDLHRAGRCAEAVPAYERAIAAGSNDDHKPLLAECYLQVGRIQEAARIRMDAHERRAASRQLPPRVHPRGDLRFRVQTPEPYGCRRVHGQPSPLRQRARLRERIARGESALATELIALDIDEHVGEDLAWLAQQRGVAPALLAELEAYAGIRAEAQSIRPRDRAQRTHYPLCARRARLPHDPWISLAMIRTLVHRWNWARTPIAGCDAAADVLALHGRALRQRSVLGDADAALALLALHDAVADDFFSAKNDADLEPAGAAHLRAPPPWLEYWDRHRRPELACAHLEDLAERGLLSSAHPDLTRAAREFPATDCVVNLVVHAAFAARGKRATWFGSEPAAPARAEQRLWAMRLAGSELRVVLERYRSLPGIDQRRTHRDAAGYYLRVDLEKESADPARVVLVGPLWTAPSAADSLGYFESPDLALAELLGLADQPFWYFDASGQLVKEARAPSGERTTLRLELQAGRAAWIAAATPPDHAALALHGSELGEPFELAGESVSFRFDASQIRLVTAGGSERSRAALSGTCLSVPGGGLSLEMAGANATGTQLTFVGFVESRDPRVELHAPELCVVTWDLRSGQVTEHIEGRDLFFESEAGLTPRRSLAIAN